MAPWPVGTAVRGCGGGVGGWASTIGGTNRVVPRRGVADELGKDVRGLSAARC